MSYTKHNFQSGAKLYASELNEMDEQIYKNSVSLGNAVEPMEDDIPKVFIDGVIPTTKDDVLAEMTYISKTEKFHAYLIIKCQGSSSMSYDKKNFTIKMYSDEARETKLKKAFKDWGFEKNKYVLKANYIDHSHARNIVSARLWGEVVASRSNYDSLPTELKTSPNNGAIDGFPIKLYANGTYQGLYTWNIGKDDWLWNMDEDNPNHILMCGETNTNDAYAETACNFRKLWSGVNENHWSVEVGTNSDSVKTSLNNLISCVMSTDDKTFMATIENHLDLQSAIDYWIHQYIICGLDGLGKNMLIGTYDLQKWIMGAYDMDSTFGLWWTGAMFVSSDFRCPEDYQERYNLLFERITLLYSDRVKERYAELRNTVYSYSNLFNHFERFMDVIGKDLYAEDLEVYTAIPSGSTNNIKQIRDYIKDRLRYCDGMFLPSEIDYTLDALEGKTWNQGYYYNSKGEYASCGDFSCTNKFELQNCLYCLNRSLTEDTVGIAIFDTNNNFVTRIYQENYNSDKLYINGVKGYKYSVYKTSRNNVTLIPVDNRETKIDTVSTKLSTLGLTMSGNKQFVEKDITSIINSDGTDEFLINSINSCNLQVALFHDYTVDVPSEMYIPSGRIRNYNGKTLLQMWSCGKTEEEIMNYFEENNTVITFNDTNNNK